jgi:hypothetical protein
VPHRSEKAFGFGERNGVLMISTPSVEIVSRLLEQSQAISNLIDGRVHIR